MTMSDSLIQFMQPSEKEKVMLLDITPQIASSWLESNKNNRPLSQSVVDRYASDMRNGRWGLSESAICFDMNGQLLNGQHRLWAVVESGHTVKFMVAVNYEASAINYMDDSYGRNLTAVYTLTHPGSTMGNQHIAIARVLNGRGQELSGFKSSRQVVFAQLDEHAEAIRFAVEAMSPKKKGITTAPVCAVIARAYYSADRGKIKRYCEVLLTGGYSNDAEKTIILLRDFLTKSISSGDRESRIERYMKTERSLNAFLHGEVLTRLYAASEELFKLPQEKK